MIVEIEIVTHTYAEIEMPKFDEDSFEEYLEQYHNFWSGTSGGPEDVFMHILHMRDRTEIESIGTKGEDYIIHYIDDDTEVESFKVVDDD